MTGREPGSSRRDTLAVLRRGLRAAPELRRGVALTFVLALAGGGGRVAVPVLVQQVLDRGFSDGEVRWETIRTLVLLGAAAVIAGSLSTRAARIRLAVASQRSLSDLRTDAFAHVHQLSVAHHTGEQRGTLVSRVTADVETLNRFLSWGGVLWLISGTMMIAVLVAMVVYDWRLTIVALVAVAPMVVVLRALQARLSVAYDTVRDRVGDVLATVSEVVSGAPILRAYGAGARAMARVRTSIRASRDANVRAATISAFLFPTNEVVSVFATASVVVAGVALGPEHGLSAGELVAFAFLVSLFLEPVSEFTELVDQTETAVAGWRKVLDLLDTPVDVVEPHPGVDLRGEGAPELRVEHVSFTYGVRRAPWSATPGEHGPGRSDLPAPEPQGGPLVLDDVDLTIPAGAHVAVVGATGSGKTTLASLLVRLADPTLGRVLVDGVDVREVRSASLRRTIVLVPQDGFLFSTTVGDNVRLARPEAAEDDLLRAFDSLGIGDWVRALPAGLATPVGERGEFLSVGERQLVSLARAQLASPRCLVLDEATSAVDPATEVRVSRALHRLAEGRTTVTIAHRLATAERADLVLVLDHGRLVETGTHGELLGRGRRGTYARLHERWLSGISA